MKTALKILGLLALWSTVVGMIIFIDPALVADVGLPNAYLPFFVAIFSAIFFTSLVFLRSKWVALIITALLVLTVVLSMMRLMYWFVALAIILLILSVCYIHFSERK